MSDKNLNIGFASISLSGTTHTGRPATTRPTGKARFKGEYFAHREWLAYKFGSQPNVLYLSMYGSLSRMANSLKRLEATVWVSFMIKPNGRLVLVSSTHCCASTSSLSKS